MRSTFGAPDCETDLKDVGSVGFLGLNYSTTWSSVTVTNNKGLHAYEKGKCNENSEEGFIVIMSNATIE
ncbi:hypothetical protein O0I10_001703 [Lichtheimia ornata]|uniref:Uncharacterized protein n=1 Tax=Lichtheimia ornata TaxID=688661 RepID=A0AAD7VB46_9FUNG|nr:uncharacterized protein O0I10_001703 [Lichtheimia ornata]KAJ8662739.1 hypothetical protein O0I10_001703 [Lichtheimia ornata]